MNTKLDEYDYQVLHLTDEFYQNYSNSFYSELIQKTERPYACLVVQSHYGYYICIPYRSNINHKYAYKFKDSLRSKRSHSGLDYSKCVIVTNPEYIGVTDAIVDQDEYRETRNKINFIVNDIKEYIDDYVMCVKGEIPNFDKISFGRKYKFSTLKYFHEELGIA